MTKPVCGNNRARRNYHLFESFEAGLILLGSEVKSLRDGKASLADAYVKVEAGEAWLVGAHIAEYPQANQFNHEAKRTRKLLLSERELKKLMVKVNDKGFSVIPTRIYFKGSWAKVEIAVAKGKKLYDKRETIKQREVDREMHRVNKRDHE